MFDLTVNNLKERTLDEELDHSSYAFEMSGIQVEIDNQLNVPLGIPT